MTVGDLVAAAAQTVEDDAITTAGAAPLVFLMRAKKVAVSMATATAFAKLAVYVSGNAVKPVLLLTQREQDVLQQAQSVRQPVTRAIGK